MMKIKYFCMKFKNSLVKFSREDLGHIFRRLVDNDCFYDQFFPFSCSKMKTHVKF